MNTKRLSAEKIKELLKGGFNDNWNIVEESEKQLKQVKLSFAVDSDTSIHFLKDAFASQVKSQIVAMVDNEDLTEEQASDFIKMLVFKALETITNGGDYEALGVVVEGIRKEQA